MRDEETEMTYSIKLDLTEVRFAALRRLLVESRVFDRRAGLPECPTNTKILDQLAPYGGACTLKLDLTPAERQYLIDNLDHASMTQHHLARTWWLLANEIRDYTAMRLSVSEQISNVVWSQPFA
jgi:hypothetical protein